MGRKSEEVLHGALDKRCTTFSSWLPEVEGEQRMASGLDLLERNAFGRATRATVINRSRLERNIPTRIEYRNQYGVVLSVAFILSLCFAPSSLHQSRPINLHLSCSPSATDYTNDGSLCWLLEKKGK